MTDQTNGLDHGRAHAAIATNTLLALQDEDLTTAELIAAAQAHATLAVAGELDTMQRYGLDVG